MGSILVLYMLGESAMYAISQDKWQAFINTIICSLSDEVIEQLRQAAITNPTQAAYVTVCA
eukprot:7230650-Karenia_brevis.AAC.1